MPHLPRAVAGSLQPPRNRGQVRSSITQRDLIPDLVLAVAAVALTSGVIWAVVPSIGEQPPLVLFTAVAAALTYWQGMGPGVLASSLGATTGSLLFIQPAGILDGRAGNVHADTLLLFGSSMVICWLIYRLKAEQDNVNDIHDRRNDALTFVSHELRQPLATVQLAAAMLERDRSEETRVRASKLIMSSAARLARFVDDLVDVTRLQRASLEIEPRVLRLQEPVLAAAQAAAPAMGEREQSFEMDVPDEPSLWINGDPSRLQQVFANLLSNASRYSPEGAEIALVLRERQGLAEVTVRDTGLGIARDMLERVFDPFIREPGRGAQGLGIGLTLVRQVIALHGGEVTAHSDGPGCGSTFVVRLPLLSETSPQVCAAE